MRFQNFLKEDVVSKALAIPEPEYKKQYDPDIAERYLDTLTIAIDKLKEQYSGMDYDPEKDVDNPKLAAGEAKLKDLQDKYNKWEEIAKADDEAEDEVPADEDPTSDPGEDPGEQDEEPVEEKRKTNKLRAVFDVPLKKPVDADKSDVAKYPIKPDEKQDKKEDADDKDREKDRERNREKFEKNREKQRDKNTKDREKQRDKNTKDREKLKKNESRLIKSMIKKPAK